jgi:hypothetical protein
MRLPSIASILSACDYCIARTIVRDSGCRSAGSGQTVVADSLEKRAADLEYMLAHVPEDLDARFAGLDVRFADLRELILLQSNRFTKLEARFSETAAKLTLRIDGVARKVEVQGTEARDLARKVDAVDAKLDEILARLPKP